MKWRRGNPMEGACHLVVRGPHRVIGSASHNSDHDRIQQRTVKEPTMVSDNLHAVTVRLDVFRDILIELAAALPPDRAADVATAIKNHLTERLGGTEIDEPADVAIVSDLAPQIAALRQPRVQRQSICLRLAAAGSPARRRLACSQGRFVFKMRVLKVDRR